MDDLPLESLNRYEKEFFTFLDSQHPEILIDIITKKEMTEEISKGLKNIIGEFTESFKKTLK